MKDVMRFGKKDKLNPKYIGTYENIRKVGEVPYELVLPQNIAIIH